ncbi:tetratricopeptide repeat-containing sulfotransferase family protein [Laspinema palackyanum]|uniref:tetratricopeptide repeat-containing sulfotransferase family protein n=1 Tax=Laspinema palackyanum TaxID=3231601 RepID=UPI00345D16F2|nr:tetratricopeptide repeat protein [Laspinema sp. D2c]
MSDFLDRKINHYKKALLIKPDNAEVYSQLAEYYYNRGQLQESATACETALKIEPNLVNASKTLALVLQEQGQVDAAFELYNNLGDLFVKEGNLEEAIPAYRCAIELKPDAYKVYYKLGEIWENREQWEDAIYLYLNCLYLYENLKDAKPLFREAYQKVLLDKNPLYPLQKLICVYRKIIKEKPDFSLAYVGLGDLLTQQGKIEEAIFCYKTASYNKLLSSHPGLAKIDCHPQNQSDPNFLIVGIGKGGTSSLYYYLTQNPRILPALIKEIRFFDENFEKGLDWYLSHFPPIPKTSTFLTGEATPWYFVTGDVEKKIASIFPEIKLILVLRNPLFRSFSHFQMDFKNGREKRSFTEAITSEIEAIRNLADPSQADFNYWQSEKGYLLFSLYVYFLEKWMAVFPREQFLILQSEDFYANPAATLTQVFEFLDVPDYALPEYPNYNPGAYNPIDDNLRQRLADFFRPHNQKLEEYLGMTFNWD